MPLSRVETIPANNKRILRGGHYNCDYFCSSGKRKNATQLRIAMDRKKMNKEDLQRIVRRYLKKLKNCIKEISPGFDAEILHQFRVEFKKLRSFLRILSAVNNSHKTGLSKKLKQAYHIAGTIRDLKLQKKRVSDAVRPHHKKPVEYLRLLQEKVKNSQRELLPILAKNPVQKTEKKTMTMLPEKYGVEAFRRYSEEKYRALETIVLPGTISDDQMHNIRKILKDLFFSNKNIAKWTNWNPVPGPWKIKDQSYLNNMLEELGNFQDRRTALTFLKPDWLTTLNSENREFLIDLKREWIKDKSILKRGLVRKLTTEFLPAMNHGHHK